MYENYEFENLCLQEFLEIPSILDNFSNDTANIIAQQTILSLKGDGCNCLVNASNAVRTQNTHGIFSTRDMTKDVDREKEKKDLNQLPLLVSKPQTVSLKSSKDVNWVLEVMKYSISMPLFTNIEVVKHTVHIYCHWLTRSMFPDDQSYDIDSDNSAQSRYVPPCIKSSYTEYANIFIASLCGFFKNFVQSYSSFYITGSVTSNISGNDAKVDYSNVLKDISILIELVLVTVEQIAIHSPLITHEIWDSLIYFCLNVGNLMLSSPSEPNQITYLLADRISCMVFRIWLHACSKCFPRPSLWKTFNKLSQMWRHQEAFINQWNKITAAFTHKLLNFMHNENFPKLPQVEISANVMIPTDLNEQYIKDCWYRFLNLIGNPVDLCIPKLILNSEILDPKSKRRPSSQSALNHAIQNLPNNFHRAMHGISSIIDAFLGMEHPTSGFLIAPSLPYTPSLAPPTQLQKVSGMNVEQASPPEVRKNTVSHPFYMRKPKPGSITARTPTMTFESCANTISDIGLSVDSIPEPHILRPEVNSMLRLFGNWLFEAAVVGVKQNLDNAAISVRASKIEASKFNAGRAEACASLCRIFTHCHRHNLSLDYLTKFYIILFYSLDIEPATASSLVLSSVIFNTIDILKIGLTGVNVLVPRLFRSVEFVLSYDIEKPDLISKIQLRRAAINHLLAMVNLPTHFIGIDIKPLLPVANLEKRDTFIEVRKNMSLLLSENIKSEADQVNLNLLIACLTALLENLLKEEQIGPAQLKHSDNPNEKIDIKVNNIIINVPSALSNIGSDIFNHSLGLLSINIVHSWKNDFYSLQFALETLSDMSKMKFKVINGSICKRAVRFLCEFIENQMGRKSKEHSKQLHNVIISAYYCLSLWLVHHPYLLDDKECLSSVLEISELGISGSKSKAIQVNGSENIQIKNNKAASPSSKRVQVATEYLLQCLMTEVGAFPGSIGVETMSSLMNEEILLRGESTSPGDDNHCCFRYFGLDNDVILALFERPLDKSSNPSDPLPTLSVIIRTTFGRYFWEMRLRQLPASSHCKDAENINSDSQYKDIMNDYSAATNMLGKVFSSRPFNTGILKQFNNNTIHDSQECDVEPSNFPDSTLQFDSFNVEFSIPKLESLMDESEKRRIESAILSNASLINNVRMKNIKIRQSRVKNGQYELQCKKPIPVSEFQTARLLLYHLGYLSINSFCYDGIEDVTTINEDTDIYNISNRHSDNTEYGNVNIVGKNNNSILSSSTFAAPIYPLDSSTSNFFAALDSLDRTPSRSTDTCIIYYVKSGQSEPSEILANCNDWPNLNPDFHTLLLSLGWLIDVIDHPGWTGCLDTSYHIGLESHNQTSISYQNSIKNRISVQNKFQTSINTNSPNIPKEFQKLIQGPVPDGTSCLIYWADSQKELAFLIASTESLANTAFKSDLTTSATESAVTPTGAGPTVKDITSVQQKGFQDKSKEYGLAVSLLWIEYWEDLENINTSQLVGGEKLIIIVSPTPGGLFRVKVNRPIGKNYGAGPLFSGMILDIKNLGTLIRQTVMNVNRRIRQDLDNYIASHFQRSLKLQQIISEHRFQHSTSQLPDFFTSLLQPPINRTEPRF